MSPVLIAVGVLVLLVIWVIGFYNTLVKENADIDEAEGQMDVQLKRRVDLIPNLVETVKGYAKHEKSVFTDVTKARTAVMNANSLEEKVAADVSLTGTLKTLFAVAENYPQLQANQNFLDLQSQLSDTEDKVAYSRQYYNTQVMEFNRQIQMVPGIWIAPMMGFKTRTFFKVEESEKQAPKVSFE